jgi:putative peptidoglycan lipid II flippase
MMAAILASRLLGLVRDAVISYRFGQTSLSDVYYAAFVVPDLLFFLIAGGALSSAFIPVFTEKITHGKHDEAWRLFSTVACVMFAVVSCFVIAGMVFTAPLVRLTTYGFSAWKVDATVPLTRIVLPAQICFFLGGLMMGVQYARQRFVYAALGPIIYNLGIILGGVFLAGRLGASGLCWGALGGAVAGNFVLQLWAVKRLGMRFHVSFDWRHPDAVRVWKLMLPVILGLALPQVSILFNRMFASALGDGPLSALQRANMLMQVPLGVFAQAMAVAIFPTLSAMAAQGRLDDMRTTISEGLRALLFLTVPASALMIALAVPIVQLLLQHGRFGPDATPVTAWALVYYAVGIFAWSAQSILARGFYALQDSRTPVIIGTAITLLFVPMNWLFMTPLGLGFRGLALATTVAAILHMMVMLIVLGRRLRGIEESALAASLARTALASIACGLACYAARSVFPVVPSDAATRLVKLHALAEILAGSAAGITAFVGAAALLRSRELRTVRCLVRRRGAGPVPD